LGVTVAAKVHDWGEKDPDETIEVGIDLAALLPSGVTLSGVVFAFLAQAGLTKASERADGTIARARLSAGTAGQNARLLLTATLSDGQILNEVAKIKIKDRT
jgi:hypothetical protein